MSSKESGRALTRVPDQPPNGSETPNVKRRAWVVSSGNLIIRKSIWARKFSFRCEGDVHAASRGHDQPRFAAVVAEARADAEAANQELAEWRESSDHRRSPGAPPMNVRVLKPSKECHPKSPTGATATSLGGVDGLGEIDENASSRVSSVGQDRQTGTEERPVLRAAV